MEKRDYRKYDYYCFNTKLAAVVEKQLSFNKYNSTHNLLDNL